MKVMIVILSVLLTMASCIAIVESYRAVKYAEENTQLRAEKVQLTNEMDRIAYPSLSTADSIKFYYNGNISINATSNSIEFVFEDLNKTAIPHGGASLP